MTDDSADTPGLWTRSGYAGHDSDPTTGARTPPIDQITSYEVEDADDASVVITFLPPRQR